MKINQIVKIIKINLIQIKIIKIYLNFKKIMKNKTKNFSHKN